MTPTEAPTLSTIEGYVWEDQDRNGQRDEGERGIPGAKLTLDPGSVQALGLSEARAVTDAHGYYRFEDVVPGVHVIRVQDPAGHWPTTSTEVEVLTALHQTVPVSFGFYRPPAVMYLPLMLKQ